MFDPYPYLLLTYSVFKDLASEKQKQENASWFVYAFSALSYSILVASIFHYFLSLASDSYFRASDYFVKPSHCLPACQSLSLRA